MKVTGPGGVGAPSASKTRPAAGGSGFHISAPAAASGPSQAAPTTGVAGVSGLDALLALQNVGGPLERRRRAVSRAGRILDVLDDVKHALLDGELGAPDLERLRRAVRDERLGTDDPGLEDVLNEIETRAAVEIAKLERAARAA
jgi:hypothetical protein